MEMAYDLILSLATIGGVSFILALSGVLTPGPLLMVTVREAMRKGVLAGPFLILGHGILELALMIAIVNGLGPFLRKNMILGMVSFFGGIFLLWMGRGMLKETGEIDFGSMERASFKANNFPLLWRGILVSLSNPYWSLWWVTVGLVYMMRAMEFGLVGLAVFFIGHLAADFLWFSMVSYGVGSGRKIIRPGVYRWITRGCGIFLFFFGCWFIITGVKIFWNAR